jgi:lactose/L-arabinose transport system ATP-binding protein
VFLFDEPLSNLDAELRVHMRIEIARLHKELATTIIYVTHDQVEAMTLADKIVVLRDGAVEQTGTPLTLYDDPDNLFVAGFIGSPKMNFLQGRVEGPVIRLPEFAGQTIPLPRFALPPSNGDNVTVGIRPETFKRGGTASLALTIELVEHLGGETFAYARQGDGQILTVAVDDGRALQPGQQIAARFDATKALVFDPRGRRIR